AGGVSASRIAKWDGRAWTALGSGVDGWIWALETYDGGGGRKLYAAGEFTSAGAVGANHIAAWDGKNWTALGPGLSDTVYALTEYDDGSGIALYTGGHRTTVAGGADTYVAKWDGTAWDSLASIGYIVNALIGHNDGNGNALYAAGNFGNIIKWQHSTWSFVGPATDSGGLSMLGEYDDGKGAALFVGGPFTKIGGNVINRIAKWDGASWTQPSGISNGNGLNRELNVLTFHDDGSGTELFVGGAFSVAGDINTRLTAKWDGESWAPLGAGLSSFGSGEVDAFAVFDDGGGPALYAGGSFFYLLGDTPMRNIAKWDGANWANLGTGVDI
ncbi:hypothetical protein AC249_AIPGENE617, partial [Exaiptasia diaphana]